MKSRLVTLFAATAVLSSVGSVPIAGSASASSTDTTIPLLREGLPESEPTLDLTKNIDASEIDQLSLDTLMKFGSEGQVEPNLASSVSQPNPVTYVYNLRHGIQFWDGNELTAADVAFSLNYDRRPGSLVAFSFTSVKSIAATGTYTVVVTLTHPDASWQYTPAEIGSEIFEMKFAEAHKGTFGNPGVLLMGTGPWEVDSLDPTSGAELSANPHWWGGEVPVQHISFTFFSSETSEALAFRAGEIDVDPSVISPRSFASTSGTKLLTTPSCGIGFFIMNTKTPGWDDVHVRRAVAYALNRSDIIAASGGYASPIYTLTPPALLDTIASPSQINSLLKSIPIYPYNLAKAKAEMAESAYPHGFKSTLLEYSSNTSVDVYEAVAAELQKIGIDAQLKVLPVQTWQGIESGPLSQRSTAFATGGCFDPDPSAYDDDLGSWNAKPGEWNVADYTPPAVDKLITEGISTTDPAKRFPIYSQLFQRLQTDLPYVGLCVYDVEIALSPKFTYSNFHYWPFNSGPAALNIKPAP